MITQRALHPQLRLRPIDDIARNGKFWLVTDGPNFAVARWHSGAWRYSARARCLDFAPTEYGQ